jgi:hypothetical protein
MKCEAFSELHVVTTQNTALFVKNTYPAKQNLHLKQDNFIYSEIIGAIKTAKHHT